MPPDFLEGEPLGDVVSPVPPEVVTALSLKDSPVEAEVPVVTGVLVALVGAACWSSAKAWLWYLITLSWVGRL